MKTKLFSIILILAWALLATSQIDEERGVTVAAWRIRIKTEKDHWLDQPETISKCMETTMQQNIVKRGGKIKSIGFSTSDYRAGDFA